MALNPGTTIGPYEIVALIGAGGMGEVYRARDARLARDVAIKILPSAFSIDPDRLRRFELEARAAAALSHPNIIAVYDVGHQDTTWYVVSELLEGQTLRERLNSSALPNRKAVEYAMQIANGLAAAHAKGIVHRDLKPENVFITDDERAKVLDFGLAKLTDPSASAVTTPGSAAGVVLGTVGYMSPEQAAGKPADHRSDIFSFGAILFEMVTGRRAFARATPAQTMAAILEDDPAETDPPSSSLAQRVAAIARRCLEKAPNSRFQSAADLGLMLGHELIDSGVGAPRVRPKTIAPAASLAALAVVCIAIGAAFGRWLPNRPAPAPLTPVSFTISLAPGEQLSGGHPVAISRDGGRIVYTSIRNGRRQLFLRALHESDAVAIPGTDDATHPVFSPDGTSIAFFADGALKRIPVTGGVSTTLAAAPSPRGLDWGADDRIIFTPDAESALLRVSGSGGATEHLTELDRENGDTNHRWPLVLPDGAGVLYTAQGRSRTEMRMVGRSLTSGTRTIVGAEGTPVQYLDTGHLVYVAVNGETFAAPFDPGRLVITGPAIPLPERPAMTGVPGDMGLYVSPGGTVVNVPFKERRRSMILVGADSVARPLAAPSRYYFYFRISPDGQRVAAVVQSGIAEWDIWVLDPRGNTPVTRTTINRFSMYPAWEADSATLLYSAFEERTWKLLSRNVDRNDPPRLLSSGVVREPIVFGWVPGPSLAYTIGIPRQTLYLVDSNGQTHAMEPPATGNFTRTFHGFSPDGKWLAYVSDQSGRRETYIMSFPDGGITRQVSRNGGEVPVWAKAGRQLYFRRVQDGRPGEIVTAAVNPDGSTGTAKVVASGDYISELGTYDVFPDGSLLMLKDDGSAAATRLDVAVNWPALRGLTKR